MNFAVPVDHEVKLQESEKRDKYPNLAREAKKLWNMTVTAILIVIVELNAVTKRLVQTLEDLEVRGRVETFQTIVLLRLTKILRRVLRLAATHTPMEKYQTIFTNTYQHKVNF